MNRAVTAPRQAFLRGVLACLAVLIGLAGLIRLANGRVSRPEGAAERWLSAISDLGPARIREDARRRAEDIGAVAIGRPLAPDVIAGDERLFEDLEVGRATRSGNRARVPFRLHQEDVPGDQGLRTGVVEMRRRGGEWRVVGLDRRRPGERVPSEGGAPPSSAPVSVWIGAVAAGLSLTVVSALLVEWAARSARRELAG